LICFQYKGGAGKSKQKRAPKNQIFTNMASVPGRMYSIQQHKAQNLLIIFNNTGRCKNSESG